MGLVFVEGMCYVESLGGVSMDYLEFFIGVVVIMVYEIGYSFGFSYDFDGCCVEVVVEFGGCVMVVVIGYVCGGLGLWWGG